MEEFLNVAKQDDILLHAFRNEGVKFKTPRKQAEGRPTLPNKEEAKLETRAWTVEKEALLGLQCAAHQSWLIQFVFKKLEEMEKKLKQQDERTHHDVFESLGGSTILQAIEYAQDATMDQLDLFARMASSAKYQRRVWWLGLTKWGKDLQEKVLKFPMVGGQLFGDKLLDTINEFKEYDEALEHAEPAIKEAKHAKQKVKVVKHTVASLAEAQRQKGGSHTYTPQAGSSGFKAHNSKSKNKSKGKSKNKSQIKSSKNDQPPKFPFNKGSFPRK